MSSNNYPEFFSPILQRQFSINLYCFQELCSPTLCNSSQTVNKFLPSHSNASITATERKPWNISFPRRFCPKLIAKVGKSLRDSHDPIVFISLDSDIKITCIFQKIGICNAKKTQLVQGIACITAQTFTYQEHQLFCMIKYLPKMATI